MFVKAVRAHVWLAPWLAVFAVLAGRFWFLCDDAYISFRFSRNWATGLGVVFNPGEVPPVEGYSNFLWVALGAGVEWIRAPIEVVVPMVSLLCGLGLLVRIGQVATALKLSDVGRHAAMATVALSPAAVVWATSGLATIPFAWLFFELTVRLLLPTAQRDPRWEVAALALAMALLRVEGLLWVALVVAVAAGVRAWRGELDAPAIARRGFAPIVVVALVYGLYTLWRIHYFGTWVPNTALVKVGFDGWIALRGVKYVAVFLLTTAAPAVAWVLGARLCGDPRLAGLLAIATAVFGYAVIVGGDFMPFGRLLVPSVPLLALLLGAAVSEGPRARLVPAGVGVGVGLLALFDLHPVPVDWMRPLHFRHSDKDFMSEFARWENQRDNCEGFARRGRALATVAEPGDAVVAAAVGAIGYLSGLEVLDQHGLVTKEVAYRPAPEGPLQTSPGHDKHVEPAYFVKYAPRFLYARTVSGELAAGKMKDTLLQWAVPPSVQDRYVPDFWEVTAAEDDERTFLVVVRHRTDDEDPAALWNGFAARRRLLNSELHDVRVVSDGASSP